MRIKSTNNSFVVVPAAKKDAPRRVVLTGVIRTCWHTESEPPRGFLLSTVRPRSGKANWLASAVPKKDRHPYTPEYADRPVSEGPGKIRGQVVRQTANRLNRCRHGALGFGGFDGYSADARNHETDAQRLVMVDWLITSPRKLAEYPSKPLRLGEGRKHQLSPLGNLWRSRK